MIEYSIETSALTIALSIDHEKFKLLPYEMLLHVTFASEYHLTKVNSGILMRKEVSYLDLLEMELKAYYLFESRYKIVKRYFWKTFQKVEEVVNQFNLFLEN